MSGGRTGEVRWGILSTARIARQHVIPAIRDSRNGRAVAIASRDKARARRVADEFEIPRAYGSYDELLADPDVDAIYNPLPISLHAEWSVRCAEAGKPVLCEKPLAANAEEARRMVEAFAERELLLAEGLMYRFHPLTRRVKAMVDDGAVGDIRLMRAVFCAATPGEDNIRLRAELAGGAMRDLGCYCVSVMRLMTGQEPNEVTATGHVGPETDVDEWVAGTLTFPSGARGTFACGLRMEFGCSYEICGTEGRITVPGGVVPGKENEATIHHYQDYNRTDIAIPPADHYRLMVEDFTNALLEGRPPTYPPEDAIHNLHVIDQALAAVRA
ncbi:MAG: Gfo/Idh/MocA family oxidoreductase [Candidatus Brocadiia bacterium]